ncbi:MAG: hypothetical protein ACP5JU_00275 [Minisyncoccia bacterium]
MKQHQEKFGYHNKSFTVIEFILYVGIISFVFLLVIAIFYAIIFYTGEYYDKLLLRNESFKILQKIYYNNTYCSSTEIAANSIKFIFNDGTYERLFSTDTTLYIENQNSSDRFISDRIDLTSFNVSTSGKFINVFIKLENKRRTQDYSLTSTIYKWGF